MVRAERIALPTWGIAGEHLRFVVQVDVAGHVFEQHEENNSAIAGEDFAIPAMLTLTLPQDQVSEDTDNPVMRGVVTRNGDLRQSLLVSLASSDTGEVGVPASVVIYAGQPSAAFAINVVQDLTPDGLQSVVISADGQEYVSGTATVQVLDADLPTLTVTLDQEELTEAGSTTATVARDYVTGSAVVVSLGASKATQLTMPSTVTIPADQAEATFVVRLSTTRRRNSTSRSR